MKRWARLAPVPSLAGSLLALSLLAACGADSPGVAAGATPTTTPSVETTASSSAAPGATPTSSAETNVSVPAGPSDLPAVSVRNLGTGETVDLKTLLPGTKPLLVWFWAPY